MIGRAQVLAAKQPAVGTASLETNRATAPTDVIGQPSRHLRRAHVKALPTLGEAFSVTTRLESLHVDDLAGANGEHHEAMPVASTRF